MATIYDKVYGEEKMPDPDYRRRPQYKIWLESLKVFLLFAIPCTVISYAAYDVGHGYQYMYYTIAFYLMPIIAVWLRRTVGNIILFVLGHILMLGWVFLSPNLILTALGVLYWISLFVYGIVRQMSREGERECTMLVLVVAMVTMTAIYMLALSRNRDDYSTMLIIQSFIYAMTFLFYQHRTGVDSALTTIDKEGNFSTRRIKNFNTKMLLVYMAFVVVVLFLLYICGINQLLGWLGSWLGVLLRKTVLLLTQSEPAEPMQPAPPDMGDKQRSLGDWFPPNEPSAFWLFAQSVLEVVFVIVMIGLILAAIYYLFHRFNQTFKYQEKGYEETKVFYKSTPKVKRKRRSFRDWFDRSPENKIRRAYYKKVKDQMGKKVKISDTPDEVGEKLANVKELVAQYDFVRYGQNGGNHE